MTGAKVLISGGGIAGNALAFWLSKLGHDVTIVERFSSLRANGLQVDLRGHGIEVMKRMGLEQAFRSKSAPEQGLQVVDSSGRRRAFFPTNKSGKGQQSFTSDFEIMRGDLCRLLYDAAVKHGARYLFGTSVENFEDKEGVVEVHFADGRVDRFDLLVGADGQGSRTRKAMLGPDTPDAFHPIDNAYVAYATIARPIQEGEEYVATMYMAPGRRGLMTRRHNEHEIQIYIGCPTDTERLKSARGNVQEEKLALVEIFKGAGWQTEDIAKSLQSAGDFYGEHIGLVKLKSWSKGRVALLGDAAYCPSANTGMGTTSAVVGAYILAGEIGKADGSKDAQEALTAAVKAYERKFRPFMDQVQKGVDQGGMEMPTTAFGIAILNCFLGVASLMRINIAAWFLKENVKGWNLPEYKEMVRD